MVIQNNKLQTATQIHANNAILNHEGLAGTNTDLSGMSIFADTFEDTHVLVPIDVAALVVTERMQSRAWADTRMETRPAPFSNLEDTKQRELGVHLHWALPDALTHGEQTNPDEAPVFPIIPDCWLITRIMTPSLRDLLPYYDLDKLNDGAVNIHDLKRSMIPQRFIKSWILENETADGQARVTPLADWHTPATAPSSRRLTAVGPSNHAEFSGYYDNVRNILGFHDTLQDIHETDDLDIEGYLTYSVIGWYSDSAYDPLSGVATEAQLFQRLEKLRWSLGAEANTRLEQLLATPNALGQQAAVSNIIPQHTLCHGAVFNVAYTADYDINADLPDSDELGVIASNNSYEGVVTALAPDSNTGSYSLLQMQLLTTVYNMLDEYHAEDGIPRLEAQLHLNDFIGFDDESAPDDPQHYWRAHEPMLLIRRATHTLRHGFDGRLTDDETLRCRLSYDQFQQINITTRFWRDTLTKEVIGIGKSPVLVDDLLRRDTETIVLNRLSLDVRRILHETILIDPISRYLLAAHAYLLQETELPLPPLQLQRISKDLALLLRTHHNPQMLAEQLVKNIEIPGQIPSLVAYTLWCDAPENPSLGGQPFIPMHLDWEFEWYPSQDWEQEWTLRETDYVETGVQSVDPTDKRIFQGRSLFTERPGRLLGLRLNELLATLKEDDPQSYNEIKELASRLRSLDMSACTLSGFNDWLAGISTEDGLESFTELTPRAPARAWRAGHLRIRKMRVVDVFGRFIYLIKRDLSDDTQPLTADEELVANDNLQVKQTPDVASTWNDAGLIKLSPRLTQPARVNLRLVAADDDHMPHSDAQPAICGWLMADHLDEALELYAADGSNLGQIQRMPYSFGVEWRNSPTQNSTIGMPQLPNAHLQGFASGLLQHGMQDDQAPRSDETALSALLRCIDSTMWTEDPLGRENSQKVAALMGHPLAVVRATLHIETLAPKVNATPVFRVRVGDLRQIHDGVIGYFINDDYTQFYPVHEDLASIKKRPERHTGFNTLISEVQGEVTSLGNTQSGESSTVARPIDHPYINPSDRLTVAVTDRGDTSQAVKLTLIVDPRGSIHVTSGILPRIRVDLPAPQVEAALSRMQVAFRFGPLLVDPERAQMPLPEDIQGGWQWVQRQGLTAWQTDDVLPAVDEAHLARPAESTEGWLRLDSILDESDEG